MAKSRSKKMASRTLWITLTWIALIPFSIIAQVLLPEISIPIGTISTFSGTISTFYIGGNKGLDMVKKFTDKNIISDEDIIPPTDPS